ncbi:hypothetical protein ACSBR2_003223 [Camellia fascicularis]
MYRSILPISILRDRYRYRYVTRYRDLEPCGQTTDVLFTADQPPASYYMAAHPYASAAGVPFDNTTTTRIIIYEDATPSTPQMPVLPAFNDTPTAHKFSSNLTGLVNGPHWTPVPLKIDEHMFVTVGLGLVACGGTANATYAGPLGQRLGASMNNASFQFPTKLSMLQAFFNNVDGNKVNQSEKSQVQFDYSDCDAEHSLGGYREPPYSLVWIQLPCAGSRVWKL